MTFTASQIAEQLRGSVLGDGSVEITGFATADLARPGDLTFAEKESYFAAAEQKVEELPKLSGGFRATTWSPDGKQIAGYINRSQGGIVTYTVASRSYGQVTPSGNNATWLPDGHRMLYVDAGRLAIVDTTTKVSTPVFSAARETLSAPGLSPGAREIYLVITKRQAEIVLARLSGAAPTIP